MKKTVRIWHAMKMRHAALTALALMPAVICCSTEPQSLEELPMEYQRMMVATSYDPRVSIPASGTFTWIPESLLCFDDLRQNLGLG